MYPTRDMFQEHLPNSHEHPKTKRSDRFEPRSHNIKTILRMASTIHRMPKKFRVYDPMKDVAEKSVGYTIALRFIRLITKGLTD